MTEKEVRGSYSDYDTLSINATEILSGIYPETEEKLKKVDSVELHSYSETTLFDVINILIKSYGIKSFKFNYYHLAIFNIVNEYLRAFPDNDVVFYFNMDLFLDRLKSEEQKINMLLNMPLHPKIKIITRKINAINATRINKDERKKLSNIINDSIDFAPNVMSTSDFLDCVDKIVDFINQNAEDDYQKVMLLSEIISKNFKYDPAFIKNKVDKGNELHFESHYAESLLTRRMAICNGISKFVKIVLNHPKINIKTAELSSYGHAWNAVQLDGKWYMCDFTAVVGGLSPYAGLRIYYYQTQISKFLIEKSNNEFFRNIQRATLNLSKPKLEVFTEKPVSSKDCIKNGDFGLDKDSQFYELPPEVVYEHYTKIQDVDVDLDKILSGEVIKKGQSR